MQSRGVHGGAAAANFLKNHRGSGAAATGFLKFIAAAAVFFLRTLKKCRNLIGF
jgi:hypothetical protein